MTTWSTAPTAVSIPVPRREAGYRRREWTTPEALRNASASLRWLTWTVVLMGVMASPLVALAVLFATTIAQ